MKFIQYSIIIVLALTSNFAKAQSGKSDNIHFTRFDVVTVNNKIAINLTTDGAVPTNYFEIQKSSDGVSFKTIALILGPDPKQSTCDCYGCFDKLLKESQTSYYRARHIGLDGSEQLTEIKSLVTL